MKALTTLLIFISSVTLFAQSPVYVGEYALDVETVEKNVFHYKLTLAEDGTFFFHYHSIIPKGTPQEVNTYGKGKWTADNNVISFFADKQIDFNEKYTLDLSNSKARFLVKPLRDKTDRVIKTRLKFLKSDIFWIKGLEIFKLYSD